MPLETSIWLIVLSSVLVTLGLLIVATIKLLFSGNAKLARIEAKMDMLDQHDRDISDHAIMLAYHSRELATHKESLRWLTNKSEKHDNRDDRDERNEQRPDK